MISTPLLLQQLLLHHQKLICHPCAKAPASPTTPPSTSLSPLTSNTMPARRQQRQQQQDQEEADAGPVWRPVHRYAFVQRLMRSGYLTQSSALDIFEQLTGSDSAAALQEMIEAQNKEMDTLSFRIKTLKHPQDKKVYVGFVNTTSDEPSKNATHLNHGQREFLKHVLAAIAADPTAQAGVGSASSIHLLNMDLSQPVPGQEVSQDAQAAAAAAVKKLSKADRERTLHSLVTEGWLQHSSSRSGHFCIGPRSFLELPDLLLGLEVPEATRVAWEDFL